MAGHHIALADARPHCFWLDRPELLPESQPRLVGDQWADLAIVGGYTGLWSAVLVKERNAIPPAT